MRANRTGNRIQEINSRNALVKNAIVKKIKQAREIMAQPKTPPPFIDYVRTLLHSGQPTSVAPLEPKKLYYKKVRYQDTLQVNSNGHCMIGFTPLKIGTYTTGSTRSFVMYNNSNSYDPTSTTNTLSSGLWNLNIVGTSGMNITSAFESLKTQSMHLKVSITGVSNLNKQGQIHIVEDINKDYYYGTASDTNIGASFANQYPLQDLPKCTHYRRVDVANMDSNSNIEYHYIPLSYYRSAPSTPTLTTAITGGSGDSSDNKNCIIIASNCAVGTTLRLEYEIVFACEVYNDYINDYPPIWSDIYVNPDPTLQVLQQNTNAVINIDKHDSKFFPTIINKGQQRSVINNKGGFTTSDPSIQFAMAWKPERTAEWHIPFHNYAGPGTRVLTRLINNKKPINDLDSAALIHDIEYMDPRLTKEQADENMVRNLNNTGHPILATTAKIMLKLFNKFGNRETYRDWETDRKSVV